MAWVRSYWRDKYGDHQSSEQYWAQYGQVGCTNKGCQCNRCTNIYQSHNAIGQCTCYDCAAFRELAAIAEAANAGTQMTIKAPESMSSINLCERCGAFATAKAMGHVTILRAIGLKPEDSEICPDCVQEYIDYWGTPGPRDGKAHTQPWKDSGGTEKDKELAKLTRMVAREYAKAQKEIASEAASPSVDQATTE